MFEIIFYASIFAIENFFFYSVGYLYAYHFSNSSKILGDKATAKFLVIISLIYSAVMLYPVALVAALLMFDRA